MEREEDRLLKGIDREEKGIWKEQTVKKRKKRR